jgi:hypothetical protein
MRRAGLTSGCAIGVVCASCVVHAPPTRDATEARPDPTAASDTLEEPKSDPTTARTVGWVSIAIGAEAAGAAAATSILILGYKTTRDDGCNAEKVCTGAGLNANSQIQAVQFWNAGAWVLAAAGLGIGAYLILTHPPDARRGVAVGIEPNGSGASLGLRSAF